MRLAVPFLAVAFVFPGSAPLFSQRTAVEAQQGMVVSCNDLASRAGLKILQRGGNAVDAAVATGLALAVTHPFAGNIGGGGFMLLHLPTAAIWSSTTARPRRRPRHRTRPKPGKRLRQPRRL